MSATFVPTIAHAAFEPKRLRGLQELVAALGLERDATPGPVVYPLQISRDLTRQGCWLTVRGAMRAGVSAAKVRGASHVVLLSDDVRPCADFWPALEAAASTVPDRPLVLMAMGEQGRKATAAGKAWLRVRDGLWGGATVWPTVMLADLLEWERRYVAPGPGDPDHTYHHDDGRMAIYLRAVGVESWQTAPCLLSHRGDEISSVMGHGDSIGGRAKVAGWFAGEGGAPRALDVDWTAGAEAPYGGTPAYLGNPTRNRMALAAQAMSRVPYTPRLEVLPGATPGAPVREVGPIGGEWHG